MLWIWLDDKLMPWLTTLPSRTQTEYSTLYSFSQVVLRTTSTLIEEVSTETACTPSVITETQTALLTVTVSPLPEDQGSGYVTVTGAPSTVTEVNTDTSYLEAPTVVTISGEPSTVVDVQTDYSYTSGAPDVTVSGEPSTVIDVRTDYSYTSGAPDVTVSGEPSTIVDVQTDYSYTSGAPDVTVSGDASTFTDYRTDFSYTEGRGDETATDTAGTITVVVTDLWEPEPTTTITTVVTAQVTLTTVESSVVETVTNYLPPAEETTIYYSSDAKGGGISRSSPSITATVIIGPPYPSNGTATISGTVTNVPGPTTPVVVSAGSKKPEPRGWGSNGMGGGLTCTVMLVAALMFLL